MRRLVAACGSPVLLVGAGRWFRPDLAGSLCERHVALAARTGDFGGWEMPTSYAASCRSTLRSARPWASSTSAASAKGWVRARREQRREEQREVAGAAAEIEQALSAN